VTAAHARPTTVAVDGADRPGIQIDTDATVIGWAVEVDDSLVSIVLDRVRAEHLDVRLVTRWGADHAR
jgi:hypothetical protein